MKSALERRYRKFGRRKSDKMLRVALVAQAVAIFYLLSLMLNGCVKTVYLPEDAGHYYELLNECNKEKEEIIEELENCLEHGSELDSLLHP